MATITVGHLRDMTTDRLQDEDEDLWSPQDFLNWYNLGARRIVGVDPRANPLITAIKMAAGVLQSCPAGTIALLDVIRNMGADGLTAGRGITETQLDALRRANPSYSTETAATVIFNYMRIPAEKTKFRVYPPSDGTTYVEIEYGRVPTIIVYDAAGVYLDAVVGVKEDYIEALFHYIAGSLYAKDTDIPGNLDKAKYHDARFEIMIGGTPARQEVAP